MPTKVVAAILNGSWWKSKKNPEVRAQVSYAAQSNDSNCVYYTIFIPAKIFPHYQAVHKVDEVPMGKYRVSTKEFVEAFYPEVVQIVD